MQAQSRRDGRHLEEQAWSGEVAGVGGPGRSLASSPGHSFRSELAGRAAQSWADPRGQAVELARGVVLSLLSICLCPCERRGCAERQWARCLCT